MKRREMESFIATFISMMIFWIILSNIFDLVHISLGIISSLIVAYFFHSLLFTRNKFKRLPKEVIRFVKYFFWLTKEIILANIDVAKIVLHPDLPISPRLIKYESVLEDDLSLTTFANSITLTPGTLTVCIDEDSNYYVHCLAERHEEELKEGEMERKVKEIYAEDKKND